MNERINGGWTWRLMLSGVVALALSIAAEPAMAAKVTVDCGKGQKIQPKIKAGNIITLRGACSENIVIEIDDVVITSDGVTSASITPADSAMDTVVVDGGKGIVLDGVVANGLRILGGMTGISVRRGASVEIKNCQVSGTSRNGIVAAYSSTVSIDACDISGNAGNGAVAANAASLVVTNSTVTDNDASGLISVRAAYLRVGQDLLGSLVARPVTVSGNNGNGISVSESASATVVGGIVESSGGPNIFVGRGSSGLIGVGSNGLTGGVTIRNSPSSGIQIEGGNATVIGCTVTGNGLSGILVTIGGSARIGITNSSNAYVGNTISNNGGSGITLAIGSSAAIGGNTIEGNGMANNASHGRYGILVAQSSASIVGGNTIRNNAASGIIVARNGQAFIGDAGFGLPIANTITANGAGDSTNGGLVAFHGGAITTTGQSISGNVGIEVQAVLGGVVELRSTSVTSDTTQAAFVTTGSTLRLRNTSSLRSSVSDGVKAEKLSSVDILNETNPSAIEGNGTSGVGVRCLIPATLTGNLANVRGTNGPSVDCNVFP